ncbi:hypothetical protein HDA39_005434 [Kribbella italica]|uniref:Uncharacterized protein n=1 Tax=Kribbella italica TaxID=1540520 RepID=A0A7W9JB36_9ACTN|nr:hypothetical protein [Kribbella italica]
MKRRRAIAFGPIELLLLLMSSGAVGFGISNFLPHILG